MKERIDPYILGLWLADKYWWGSSVGLSNTDERLILRFTRWLLQYYPPERVKLKVYVACSDDLYKHCSTDLVGHQLLKLIPPENIKFYYNKRFIWQGGPRIRPSPARAVRSPVKSGKSLCGGLFLCDYRLFWLAGLWDADRGSKARGIVSLKNKCFSLLAGFIIVSEKCLGVRSDKFRIRVTYGYSRL